VTVANLKGGVGKTTTAVYLARNLKAVLVDADPQGSAVAWGELAAETGEDFGIEIVHLPTPKLRHRLPAADRLVIDCSPRDHAITDAAIAAASLVVVPSAPSTADLDRTWATLDLCASFHTAAVVLLVKVRPNTCSLAAAGEALAAERVHVLAAHIPQREALAVSWGRALATNQFGYDLAANEIKELLNA
jgi:chromosome partitioning protein